MARIQLMSIDLSALQRKITSPQFVRFFVSGFSGFMVDFLLLSFQVYILHFDLFVLEVISIPNVISSIASQVLIFALNRWWTFGLRTRDNLARHSGKFILVASTIWLIHNICFGVLVQAGIPHPAAKVGILVIQMFVSFAAYKYIVFRK